MDVGALDTVGHLRLTAPVAIEYTIDTREVRSWEEGLADINKRGLFYAHRDTLTESAVKLRELSQQSIQRRMILRNQWTARGIAFDRAKGRTTRDLVARTGALAKSSQVKGEHGKQYYLATQEFGGVERRKPGALGVSLPTPWASKESGIPRKRLALPSRSPRGIDLPPNRWKAKSARQKRFLAIKQAVETGKRSALLEVRGKVGLFKVSGGSKRKPETARIDKAQDLSAKQYNIPRNPWMRPALTLLLPRIGGIYKGQLQRQLRMARHWQRLKG